MSVQGGSCWPRALWTRTKGPEDRQGGYQRQEKGKASEAASETQSCHNTEAHPKPRCWHWLHQAEACRASNSEQARWGCSQQGPRSQQLPRATARVG